MKYGLNRVQVPPFDPKLRQDEATASRNPPECLKPPKTTQIHKNGGKKNPLFPPVSPILAGPISDISDDHIRGEYEWGIPGWLVGWLLAWLLGCLVAWLLGCLVAWLIG